jgi:HEAT repeat protein
MSIAQTLHGDARVAIVVRMNIQVPTQDYVIRARDGRRSARAAWILACAAMLVLLLAGSGPQPNQSAPSPSMRELERDLADARAEKRRSTVKKLAALDTKPAWHLVIAALEDKEPEVADEAQMALGAVKDPALVDELLGRRGLGAQDAWVRLRVAESFGRMSIEIDGLRIARELSPRTPEVSRTLLWSIDRLLAAKHLGGDRKKLTKAVVDLYECPVDPGLRGAALVTLSGLDYFTAEPLVRDAMKNRERTLRSAAVAATRGWIEQECLSVAQQLLDDPEQCVRAAAIENLQQLSTRESILSLVRWMDLEKRSRLRWQILDFLQRRSGLKHGFDRAAWEAWAGTVQGRWTTGSGSETASVALGDTQVGFAGLNLISDRVCFLIDLSGSVWTSKVGDKTRKEIVDEQLRAALQALPSGTSFNVIPYTSQPIPWERRLVPSTPANVKRAIEWFERCHRSGRGNYFDAVQLALLDPDVDTIVALSDGAPTGGHRWNLELMVELLVEQNRFRKVAFDSVLVDAKRAQQMRWADLAQRTGGRAIVAKLADSDS